MDLNPVDLNPVFGVGGAPPFSPTDVAGLALWLDASDTSTVVSDINGVSQWSDKSGNGYHLSQTDNARKPTYTSGQHLSFVGNGLRLTRVQQLGLTSITIFAVSTKGSNVAFGNQIISQGEFGQNWQFQTAGTGSGNVGSFRTNISNAQDDGRFQPGDITLGAQHIFSCFYDETTGDKRGYVDGNIVDQITLGGAMDTDETNLGVGGSDTMNSDMTISEIIVYNNSVSETDANKVAQYLSDKRSGSFDGTFDGTFV